MSEKDDANSTAPAKVWFIATPYYESDFEGYLWAGEDALNYSTLRMFTSEKKAREEAAKEGRECLRADLEHNTLRLFCPEDLVNDRERLAEILHDEGHDDDLFRAPFRELTDVECDEVLELLPHLQWIVSVVDINRQNS